MNWKEFINYLTYIISVVIFVMIFQAIIGLFTEEEKIDSVETEKLTNPAIEWKRLNEAKDLMR